MFPETPGEPDAQKRSASGPDEHDQEDNFTKWTATSVVV